MSLLQSFYRFHSCWMPDKFHTLSHLPFCSRKCVPHFLHFGPLLYSLPHRYLSLHYPHMPWYRCFRFFHRNWCLHPPHLPSCHRDRGNSDYNHNIPGWLNCCHWLHIPYRVRHRFSADLPQQHSRFLLVRIPLYPAWWYGFRHRLSYRIPSQQARRS